MLTFKDFVFLAVLFLMLSLGEEVGDDSVPLGVYSVPGFAGNQWGWPWLQTAVRSLLRHLSAGARSDARRLALLFVVNMLGMLLLVGAGLYHWNNCLFSLALRLLYTCVVLAIGLLGTINKYSRASLDFSYGFGRFETLCGFTNALLLAFTKGAELCAFLQDSSPGPTLLHGQHGRLLQHSGKVVIHDAAVSPPVSLWLAFCAFAMQGACAGVVSILQKSDAALARGKAAKRCTT